MNYIRNTSIESKFILVIALICLLLWLIARTIIGVLCYKMADKKGYTGYFGTGFFLGIIGFVYVIFLPDLIMRRYIENCSRKNIPIMDYNLDENEKKTES